MNLKASSAFLGAADHKRLAKLILPLMALTANLFLSGCGFVFDEHLTGQYRLIAVDADEQMRVCYDLGDGNTISRISETVFAVGWNERFVVAKQHPEGNRAVTHYYYLDMEKDSPYADPSESVTGPLSEEKFAMKRQELNLPPFRQTIKSLE